MNKIRLLIVEDEPDHVKACEDSAEVYKQEHGREIELTVCKNVDEAYEVIDRTFDGAIIDLRIDDDPTGGDAVIDSIADMRACIPDSDTDRHSEDFRTTGIVDRGVHER